MTTTCSSAPYAHLALAAALAAETATRNAGYTTRDLGIREVPAGDFADLVAALREMRLAAGVVSVADLRDNLCPSAPRCWAGDEAVYRLAATAVDAAAAMCGACKVGEGATGPDACAAFGCEFRQAYHRLQRVRDAASRKDAK